MTETFPTPDSEAGRALGETLRRLGYTEDAVTELLGDDVYGGEPGDAPLHVRRLPQSPLATAIKLLFLEQPVEAEEAERAFGREGVEALARTGLAGGDGLLRAGGRVLPVGDILVASDLQPGGAGGEPAEYVSTYTPTTQLCDALTPRQPVERALDVGTGNGALAVLAARHARHVVATDVNPRALRLTQLNAALNGVDNLEVREGSLFEPVEGEEFDLITCNAPFVVSPEERFVYRDSGLRGDEFSARLVAGAALHLREGGHATMLASWVGEDADEPDERVLEWVAESGCDAWILSTSVRDALDHAAAWSDEESSDGEFAEMLDEWSRYFAELGVACVSEGAVLLHRGPGAALPVRVDEIDDETFDAGAQVLRAFAARDRLAGLTRARLLGERVALAMPVTVEVDVAPGRRRLDARVVLDDGTQSVVDAPVDAVDILRALDGRTPLADIAARPHALELARELLELGAATFAD